MLIDPYTADVLQTIDARQQGAGTRLMHALYPVHAATVGGIPLAVLAVVTAFGLGWLAIGGSWTFLGRALRRPWRASAGTQEAAAGFGTVAQPSRRYRPDIGTTSNL